MQFAPDSLYPLKITAPLKLILWLPLKASYRNETE